MAVEIIYKISRTSRKEKLMIHVVNCDNFHKGKKNYTMREVGLKGAFLFFFCNETLRGRPS